MRPKLRHGSLRARPFALFVTTQNVNAIKRLNNSLYSGDGNETTAVVNAVIAKGSLRLSSMINATEKVLHILDLVGSEPYVHALVSCCLIPADVYDLPLIIIIVLDEFHSSSCRGVGCREGGWGRFKCSARHWLTALRIHDREAHTCRSELHLICWVKRVWVRVGLHLLHDNSRANDNEIKAVIVDEGVVVHMALQSAVCIVCAPAQRAVSTLVSFPLVCEQCDSKASFEATILSWLAIIITNDGPLK